MAENIYRIDDALIRAGVIFSIAALIAVFNLPGMSATGLEAWAWTGLALLFTAPLCMLTAGYAVRRRERRLVEIWRLLKEHGEMPVSDLLDMSGYSRTELRKAVSLLNRKIAAGLTWDEDSDSVRHLRLGPRATLTHSQRCPSCGASVSVEVNARSHAEALRCTYCQGALDGKSIGELQSRLLAREAGSRDPEPQAVFFTTQVQQPARPARPFSIGLFVILLVFFWPAAMIYAIHRASTSRMFS